MKTTKLTKTIPLALLILAMPAMSPRVNADIPPAPAATEIAGNLDIRGNSLTFGSWTDAVGTSVYAVMLSFVGIGLDGSPAVLRFAAAQANTDWVWSRPGSVNATVMRDSMRLDAQNRLILYSTSGVRTIMLDPNGKSQIEPQGDLSMGEFTARPQ